jgi:hypothetical protein
MVSLGTISILLSKGGREEEEDPEGSLNFISHLHRPSVHRPK